MTRATMSRAWIAMVVAMATAHLGIAGPGSTGASSMSTTQRTPLATEPTMVIPEDVRQFLLTLARQSLEACVNRAPRPQPGNVPAIAREKCGCFVTLTMHGKLRGCIGYLEGIAPLYEAIIQNAENAATKDHRFEPVDPRELKEIVVEISVLTPPVPLDFAGPDDLLSKIVPDEDGIILHSGTHQSTFLPQVWEQLPDKVQFLEHLAVKGGMGRDGWKTASVKRYRAIHFSETPGK